MALHINLYHEVLRQEIQRQRDPLKLSIYALIAVAALFVGYYMIRFGQVRRLNSQVTAMSNQWDELAPKAEAARKETVDVEKLIKTGDTLLSRIEGRFFWAPLFEEITNNASKDVQITSANGELARETPGTFTLMVSGLAAGTEPRTVAEDFRTTLLRVLSKKYKAVSASFRSLEESGEPVIVKGRQVPAVVFTIHIRNNDPSVAAVIPAAKP